MPSTGFCRSMITSSVLPSKQSMAFGFKATAISVHAGSMAAFFLLCSLILSSTSTSRCYSATLSAFLYILAMMWMVKSSNPTAAHSSSTNSMHMGSVFKPMYSFILDILLFISTFTRSMTIPDGRVKDCVI